jgi:hypothetical protein
MNNRLKAADGTTTIDKYNIFFDPNFFQVCLLCVCILISFRNSSNTLSNAIGL